MWLVLNDSFMSIVQHKSRRHTLVVRARQAGDIELVFPQARVYETPQNDYRFRAYVARKTVAKAVAREVERIDYHNFKNSVADDERHDAYSAVWLTLMRWGAGAFKRKAKPAGAQITDWVLPDFDDPNEPQPFFRSFEKEMDT